MNTHKQKGMTMMGWLVVAIMIAAAVTVAMRLGPHYVDFRTIQAVMNGLPESELHLMRTRDIQELLKKRMKINNVRDLDLREAITIDRTKEETVLIVNYERREPLIYNVDAVMVFEESFRFE